MAASTVGAIAGDVTVIAGGSYQQTGSDVLAPGGDVSILARDIAITESHDSLRSRTEEKFKQGGLSLSLGGGVISAVQGMASTAQAVGETKNERMQALGAATLALQGQQLLDSVGKIASASNPAQAAGVSISLGGSKNESVSETQASNARGSSVTAGGSVNLVASGAGQASTLLVQGSDVMASDTVRLIAEGDVTLQAARNEAEEHSRNKSSSGSIGIGFSAGAGGGGFGVMVSASQGKGQGDGYETTHRNTHVNAGQLIVLDSGGDTTLKGAVAQAAQVQASVGGKLNIESLQDTSTYDETSKNSGFSVTVGAGAGGSISAGKTKIESDYASVKEQSGIRAGDGGFQVSVQGGTTLTGGAITSSQAAVDAGVNHFESQGGLELSDIHNNATYKAGSSGMTVGVGGQLGASGAGVGSDKDSASSTTVAAISGVAGNQGARTGDAETGIATIFDKERVKEEVAAQVAITTAFMKQAPKAWADYAGQQQKDALARGDQIEAEKWGEGGAYRATGHMLLGTLGGGVAGAASALASATAMPEIGKLIDSTDLPEPVKQALGMVASTTLGAVVGGAAGAATAFGIDTYNRQLHPSEKKLAQDLAKKSGGKYTPEQIEEQMRLMGNKAFGDKANSTEVLTTPEAIANNVAQDPNMPKSTDGRTVVEIPGQANMDLQQYIIGNSTSGADYIPGQSPYVASNAQLNNPLTNNTPSQAATTAACANGDLACKSGVGAQQSSIPKLTQAVSEAIADGAASTSRQAGVIAAGAIAAAAAGSPQVKPIAGAVAVGATAIGVGADAVEQVMRPDIKQAFREQLLLGVPADVLARRYPLYAPIINEIKESLQ